MNGVIIGRFMPPHNGHLYLIDFARHIVDTLYILVCTLSHEPIPGDLRFRWVRELAPSCHAIHITEEIPEARRGAVGATAIWAKTVREAVPATITHVFASEEYGWDLAKELNARFIPVDPSRRNIPVSATAVRRNPYVHWQYIPSLVRPYFVKHLAVVGATDVAERLADDLKTVVVHSYRAFWEQTWRDAEKNRGNAEREAVEHESPEMIIRSGIRATASALARHANRILIYDLPGPRALSEIGEVDAVVTTAENRDDCSALVPERPILSISDVSATNIEHLLLTADTVY